MDDLPSDVTRKSGRLFYLGGVLTVLVVVGMLGLLLWKHETRLEVDREARKKAVEEGPLVRVATATRAPERKQVELIGEARPYTTTTLYAKVSGKDLAAQGKPWFLAVNLVNLRPRHHVPQHRPARRGVAGEEHARQHPCRTG